MQRHSQNPSPWVVRDLYTAHFALSDVQAGRHMFFERTNREAIGWAGAEETPGRIWNGNWELMFDGDAGTQRLAAEQDGHRLQLTLRPVKPLVLHGERGISRKGPSLGNASYYYSFPRLETSGEITISGETFAVTGTSWMDHEFSSSFLEAGQQGWDWFSVQLDSGHELMLYQIRREDGAVDARSSGTWVEVDGSARSLAADEFRLAPTPGETWSSATTGATYPLQWRVQVPNQRLDVMVRASFPQQEMDTSASTGVVYWEGCVTIDGTREGRPVRGQGYLEMTGYAGRGLGALISATHE
jgi:predicted secreted hydrolase